MRGRIHICRCPLHGFQIPVAAEDLTQGKKKERRGGEDLALSTKKGKRKLYSTFRRLCRFARRLTMIKKEKDGTFNMPHHA